MPKLRFRLRLRMKWERNYNSTYNDGGDHPERTTAVATAPMRTVVAVVTFRSI